MSPALQVCAYTAAIVLFLAAAWGINSGRTPSHALGWLGVALVTLVLLAGAVDAL